MAQRGSPETVKRKELVGKLNETCLRAFSGAAQAAKARGNPYVELAHFIEGALARRKVGFRNPLPVRRCRRRPA